ncbi:hypothetical protein [uncultured Fusobacterium sp.]|uniref:hypothetical protein n=1 Tax=uncultured Fusobacterium sp. TaxID=159267 RepID=UPI0015A69DC7|nr:hypothetical protein [uncultured Fusobacterium sp.]
MDKIKELICFTKIFNKLEYAESFLEGNIRFTPLKNYVLIEDGRKDFREGLILNLQPQKTEFKVKMKEKIKIVKNIKEPIAISLGEVLNRKCFCLSINRWFNFFKEKNSEEIKFEFQGVTEEEIKKFGEYIVVINNELFLKRILKYFEDNRISPKKGKVKYEDLSKFHGEIEEVGFVKDIKYRSENEYRILVDMSEEGVQTINIGSLKDIAMIVNYEEFKSIFITKNEN